MRKAATIFTVAALAAFGAAACGDDEEDEATTQAQTTTQATDTAAGGGGAGEATVNVSSPESGEFAYDQETLTAPAGTVTFNYDNPSTLSHDFILESEQGSELGRTDLVSQGSDSVTVDLQPGTYTYYCDVPGHREGGMEGTLTVK